MDVKSSSLIAVKPQIFFFLTSVTAAIDNTAEMVVVFSRKH